MKTLLVAVSLAVAGAGTVHAQIYRPSTTAGAVLGAIAGGLIGGHNGDRWAEGIAIGAVTGAVMGSAVDAQRPVYQTTPPPVVYGQSQPIYGPGQPVYASSGQVVYGQPGQVAVQAPVPNAPTFPTAPSVYSAPPVVYPAPQIVYVESAPRVVYVQAPPRVVYVESSPSVAIGYGYYSGPRHYSTSYRNPGYGHGPHGHGRRR